MPNYTIVGDALTALVEASESTLQESEDGVQTATLKFHGKWPGIVEQAAALTSHPDFSYLKRTTFNASRSEGAEMATVTVNYKGVPVIVGQPGTGVKKTYSLQGSTNSEPIETHPDFAAGIVFGGFPKNGAEGTNAKGASFDKDLKFKGFMMEHVAQAFYPDANKNKAGVKSYLAPGTVYSEKAVYTAIEEIPEWVLSGERLGVIDVPPASPLLPTPGGAYSWLLLSINANEVGEGAEVSMSWKLSGSRGWDIDIYS